MADAAVSNTAEGNLVWVRIPSSAPPPRNRRSVLQQDRDQGARRSADQSDQDHGKDDLACLGPGFADLVEERWPDAGCPRTPSVGPRSRGRGVRRSHETVIDEPLRLGPFDHVPGVARSPGIDRSGGTGWHRRTALLPVEATLAAIAKRPAPRRPAGRTLDVVDPTRRSALTGTQPSLPENPPQPALELDEVLETRPDDLAGGAIKNAVETLLGAPRSRPGPNREAVTSDSRSDDLQLGGRIDCRLGGPLAVGAPRPFALRAILFARRFAPRNSVSNSSRFPRQLSSPRAPRSAAGDRRRRARNGAFAPVRSLRCVPAGAFAHGGVTCRV